MMKIDEARTIGEELITKLRGSCYEIMIGGSIRRLKPEVKDIEIICSPQIDQTSDLSRLDNSTRNLNRLDQTLRSMLEYGDISRDRPRKNKARPPFGSRTYLIKYNGQPVDIFSIHPPADWFTQVVIRTGSEDFNIWLVSTCKKRRGVRFVNGHIERQDIDPNDKPPDTEIYFSPTSERDVFSICGIEYIDPENRGPNFMDYVKEL